MKALFGIARLLVRQESTAFFRGAVLSLAVLGMGVALLALSGWFITAATAAGLAGIGILFNVFAPSAMVRFLALGRSAARYGERVLTHDATLRGLSRLRIGVLQGAADSPWRQVERLRANSFLNRVTSDIDALDGVLLRLILPGAAGLSIIFVTALCLAWLVDWRVAIWVGAGYAIAPVLIFAIGQFLSRKPARRAEAGLQAGRSRMIDLISNRDDLLMYGRLQSQKAHVARANHQRQQSQTDLSRIEQLTGLALDLASTLVAGGALYIGASLVMHGEISPAQAAIAIFASIALQEAIAPLRRALAEIGRMARAADRVFPSLAPLKSALVETCGAPTSLRFDGVTFSSPSRGSRMFRPLSFKIEPGQTVALTGSSGSGKSTALLMAAGVLPASSGAILVGENPLESLNPDLRLATIAMVPQRHALISGTVRQNLCLAAPNANDSAMWSALQSTALDDVVRAKGGLEAVLGPRGSGFSGGESRRLVLARALLRKPAILLLDEPTEGLDSDMAGKVLSGIRSALPDAAILLAAHRVAEIDFADHVVPVRRDRGSDELTVSSRNN